MKSIIVIMKSIFVPVSAFMFLAVGILACCFSGVIEYHVLKEFLIFPNYAESEPGTQLWPVILVLVLEGAKFTLHFYHASLKRRRVRESLASDENSGNLEHMIRWVKKSLIAVSFVCSVIFTTNIFYGDNGKTASAQRVEVNEECDRELERYRVSLTEEKSRKIQEVPNLFIMDQEKIDDLYDDLKDIQEMIAASPYKGVRTDLEKEAEALRIQISSKEELYRENLQRECDKIETWYAEEWKRVEEKYGLEGSERKIAESSFEEEAMGDNVYLYTFLRSVTMTFFRKGYNRMTYFSCVMLISALLAALLEACIAISQSLLTLQVGTFQEILGELPATDKELIIARAVGWLLLSIFCLLAVYIVAGLCLNINVSREQIVMAAISYIVTLLFMNFCWRFHAIDAGSARDETTPLWKRFLEAVPDTLVSGLLAFAGYVLLGFVFDGNFVYGDLNSLAIAFGGMMAQCFRREPVSSRCTSE